MVVGWGIDVPKGEVTDFGGAARAQDNETVALSWIMWPDPATADAARESMRSDPPMRDVPQMPFDRGRMIFGGFAPVFQAGNGLEQGFFQGFLLPRTRRKQGCPRGVGAKVLAAVPEGRHACHGRGVGHRCAAGNADGFASCGARRVRPSAT